MLLSLLFIITETSTLNLLDLLFYTFSNNSQQVLWLTFFFAFAIKVPMYPFHLWLPEAHVEAPTSGSVILAGVLLKLGGYGFLRFLLPLFPSACIFFKPLIFLLSLLAIILSSLTAIRQIDLKKIIAYSSIAHMGFVTLGIFSETIEGILGSIFLMISHGLVASSLFFSIGILYDRYHTRMVFHYTGLVTFMPLYGIFLLFFILSNIGMPGTMGFVGEILVLFGLIQKHFFITLFAAFSILLGAIYSIWLYNRIMFGFNTLVIISSYSDINLKESIILLILSILILFFGILPNFVLSLIKQVLPY